MPSDQRRTHDIRYTRLFEAAQDGVLLLNHPEGVIEDANPYICRMMEYTRNELIGKNLWEIGLIADRRTAKKAHQTILKTGLVRYDNLNLVTKSGKAFESEFICNAYDVEGETFIQCNIRDITERKKAEAEMARIRARELSLLKDVVSTLSNVIESRDPFTAGHHTRVAHLAVAIAKELQLPEDQQEHLQLAALVHDIGKIAIPVEILTKPSALEPPEREMLKAHSQRSYDILKPLNLPSQISDCVLQHHERLDGSGYPNGLIGDQICMNALILIVADTVESMSSNRPYRPSLGINAALHEIESNKNRLYDANVVDACIRLFREKNYTLPTLNSLRLSHVDHRIEAAQ